MPVFNRFWSDGNGGVDHLRLTANGPALEVEIAVTQGYAKAVIAAGKSVPNPKNGTALIDTGAGVTAVDVKVLDALGLNPVSTTPIFGPTGYEEQGIYVCQLTLLGTDIGPFDQMVVGSQLERFGHIALLGRPMLRHMLMVYDGKHGTWTLAV